MMADQTELIPGSAATTPAYELPGAGDSREEQAAVEELRESVCTGAGPFLAMVAFFVIVGVVVPIVLYFGLEDPVEVGAIICFCVGWLFCCYGLAPALLPPPKPPPTHGPFGADTDLDQATTQVRRLYILVNPKSGTFRPSTLQDRVLPKLQQAGIQAEVHETQYAGHARDLARTLPVEGFDGLVVIGGDGTLHEAVNGMLQRGAGQPQLVLGVIPGGSGNSVVTDFKHIRDIAKNIDAAVDAIIAGCAPFVDVNRVSYGPQPEHVIHSINVVGWTADQCMGAINIDSWRPILGTARYDICALWGLLKGREAAVRVSVDGQPVTEAASTFFLNHTQHFGKQMRACPHALWDDGRFDIAFISAKRRGEVVRIFGAIQKGGHGPLVEERQGQQCILELPEDTGLFNVDGEVVRFQGGRIQIDCLPKSFRLFSPR